MCFAFRHLQLREGWTGLFIWNIYNFNYYKRPNKHPFWPSIHSTTAPTIHTKKPNLLLTHKKFLTQLKMPKGKMHPVNTLIFEIIIMENTHTLLIMNSITSTSLFACLSFIDDTHSQYDVQQQQPEISAGKTQDNFFSYLHLQNTSCQLEVTCSINFWIRQCFTKLSRKSFFYDYKKKHTLLFFQQQHNIVLCE